jgi:hypothetical protein
MGDGFLEGAHLAAGRVPLTEEWSEKRVKIEFSKFFTENGPFQTAF